MNPAPRRVSRRRALGALAGGAAGLMVPVQLMAQTSAGAPRDRVAPAGAERRPEPPFALLASWIRIAPDESVVLYMSQCEMGQGTRTGLAQILADELEADWARIRIENAPTGAPYQVTLRGFTAQFTAASSSTVLLFDALRSAGARARRMLLAAAAARWGVPAAECTAAGGFVTHAASGSRASYGTLALRASTLPVPDRVELKPREAFRFIGKPLARLDTPAKSDGSAMFGIDVRLPDMLHAAVRHQGGDGSGLGAWRCVAS